MCFEPVRDCSGNGLYNNATRQCECFEGFTSLADFRYAIGHDCDVSIIAIRVIYGVTLALLAIPLIMIFRYFATMGIKSGWKKPFDLSVPLTKAVHSIGCFLVFYMIFCCLKLASPRSVMGMDLVTSVVFFIWQMFLWLSIVLVTDLFVLMTMRSDYDVATRMVPVVRVTVYSAMIPLTSGSILLLVSYFRQDIGCTLTLASFYLTASTLLLYALGAPIVFNLLIRDIKVALKTCREQFDHGKEKEWSSMLARIVALRRDMFVQPMLNSAILFLITSVPSIFNNLTYYEAALGLSFTIPAFTIVYNLTVHKTSKDAPEEAAVKSESRPSGQSKIVIYHDQARGGSSSHVS